MIDSKTHFVLLEVAEERAHQDNKWGTQHHPNGTGGLVAQALSAVYREECDNDVKKGLTTWKVILLEEVYEALAEEDPAKLREELVQVCAVACSWVEAIDRKLE